MKILAVAEFDCAGVLAGHRAALRALGVDYRLAVKDVYPRKDEFPDWQLSKIANEEELLTFAAEADILQFHPGIGQPWSYTTLHPHFHDGASMPFGPVDWASPKYSKAKRISFFHGSRNAAVNAREYALYWRGKGHAIWTSTLDYASWMEATYAPPVVDLEGYAPAKLRGEDDPLVLVHAPTDPENCHTAEITSLCRRMGIVLELCMAMRHDEVLKRKASSHAGFDHLRGTFSVNTVENCLLGLAPLVGVKRSYLSMLADEIGGPVWEIFPIETLSDLEARLWQLAEDPEETTRAQSHAFNWASHYWRPDILGKKLLAKYYTVLEGS